MSTLGRDSDALERLGNEFSRLIPAGDNYNDRTKGNYLGYRAAHIGEA